MDYFDCAPTKPSWILHTWVGSSPVDHRQVLVLQIILDMSHLVVRGDKPLQGDVCALLYPATQVHFECRRIVGSYSGLQCTSLAL